MQCYLITVALHFPCCIQGRKKDKDCIHIQLSHSNTSYLFSNYIISIVVKFSRAFILVDSFPLIKKKNTTEMCLAAFKKDAVDYSSYRLLHLLFKDFSFSVSQLSPNPIPIALLDAFCSFISYISFTLYSTHSQLFAKTILFPWEWTRHSHQCFSTLTKPNWCVWFLPQYLLPIWPPSLVFCPFSCPFRRWGNAFSQHFSFPSATPPVFPYCQVCPTQEAWLLSHSYREGYKLNN